MALPGQAIFKVTDQHSQNIVLINSRSTWPTKFYAIFKFLGQSTVRCTYYYSKKC